MGRHGKAGVGSEVGQGLFYEAMNQESDALEGGERGEMRKDTKNVCQISRVPEVVDRCRGRVRTGTRHGTVTKRDLKWRHQGHVEVP